MLTYVLTIKVLIDWGIKKTSSATSTNSDTMWWENSARIAFLSLNTGQYPPKWHQQDCGLEAIITVETTASYLTRKTCDKWVYKNVNFIQRISTSSIHTSPQVINYVYLVFIWHDKGYIKYVLLVLTVNFELLILENYLQHLVSIISLTMGFSNT